ncbi:MAG: hypothetical protein WCJ41_14500 [Aestuariivirga sp.]|uniref:hypothetical protein n=1 Tax=Aestuariivirga sp. TaxID=2650926 RepID=UPI0030189E75
MEQAIHGPGLPEMSPCGEQFLNWLKSAEWSGILVGCWLPPNCLNRMAFLEESR